MKSEITSMLREYRSAQVSGSMKDDQFGTDGRKRRLFIALEIECLELHGHESEPPSLFRAICRGPRDSEATGADWDGIEPYGGVFEEKRLRHLWKLAKTVART